MGLKLKKTMNIKEIAQKYGVPTPETCKELNWQGETLFYWYLENKENENFFWNLYHKDNPAFFEGDSFIPAPQMHEIARELPTYIYSARKKNTPSIISPRYFVNENSLWEFLELEESKEYEPYDLCYLGQRQGVFRNDPYYLMYDMHINVDIKNHHYAQAYAELYLKLKAL